jgi:hypothetical protein
MVENTELEPFDAVSLEFDAVPLPPAPTVTVYVVPAVTEKPVAVLNPPAPPPAPPSPLLNVEPPPPPPATTKYSTSVTPVGHTHSPVAVKDWMTVTKFPDSAVNPYALAQATARDDRIGIAFS